MKRKQYTGAFNMPSLNDIAESNYKLELVAKYADKLLAKVGSIGEVSVHSQEVADIMSALSDLGDTLSTNPDFVNALLGNKERLPI